MPLHVSWHRVTHYVRDVSWITMRMSTPWRVFGKWAFTLSWMIERTTNYERATTDCQILNILHGPPSRLETDCKQRSSGNWIERDKRECLDVLIWIFGWISRVYRHVWKAYEETEGPFGPQSINKENHFVCRRDFGNLWETGSAIGH